MIMLVLTRWLTICEPEVFPLELQNHLRHEGTLHLTTHAGFCTPQYLHACSVVKSPFPYSYPSPSSPALSSKFKPLIPAASASTAAWLPPPALPFPEDADTGEASDCWSDKARSVASATESEGVGHREERIGWESCCWYSW